MKTRAIFSRLIVAALLLIVLAVPTWAANGWVEIYKSNNGDYYLRRSSIEDNGSYVIGWVKCVLSDSLKSETEMQSIQSLFGHELSYGVVLYGAKKGSRQIRIIQIVCYDENDYSFFSMDEYLMQLFGQGQWEYCVPDSTGEAVWEALMKAAGIRY